MSTNLKLLGDRVAIKSASEEVSAGGLIINDQKKSQFGEVIAVGPGGRTDGGETIPMTLTVGMKVVFMEYSGSEIKVNDDKYLIMRESDVIGVLEG